jgi:hypothetical protein
MKIKKAGPLKSFEEVKRGGWWVKMSILSDHYILAVIRSELTGQTIVRHFDDDGIAASFVDFVCELEADQEHDL